MTRTLLLMIFLSCLLLPAPSTKAASAKVSYEFSASADKATAIVVRKKKNSFRKVGTCKTPCVLKLNPNHVDFVIFQHDNYSPLELSRKDLPTGLLEKEASIKVYGDLGLSHTEKKAEAETKYRKARETALAKINSEARPWTRIPPVYPIQSLVKSRSGWCQVRFDVNAQGLTENISAFNCSESAFKKNAEVSVQKWIYIPAVEKETFVSSIGIETILKFQFNDEDGNPIAAKIPLPE